MVKDNSSYELKRQMSIITNFFKDWTTTVIEILNRVSRFKPVFQKIVTSKTKKTRYKKTDFKVFRTTTKF